jgi:hypothetical protein
MLKIQNKSKLRVKSGPRFSRHLLYSSFVVLMDLLQEARDAVRTTIVPAGPAFEGYPETTAAHIGLPQQLINQSALRLFRDALLSNAPLDAGTRLSGSSAALAEAAARDAEASSHVESQRMQLRVLAESVARVNGTVASLSKDLEGEADKLAHALSSVNPSLPTSLALDLPSGAVSVTSEEQARDIMAAQVGLCP